MARLVGELSQSVTFRAVSAQIDQNQDTGEGGIIADNIKKAGWGLGWVSAIDCEGRIIWILDAYRDDGKRFVVHAEEKLTAFLELESVIKAKT
jgi:hypothetical protein